MGPVFVGVVAPGEVRQHRQRAGERKNAIGAGASRHGPVRELVYEARHMSQRLRHRAGVVKALLRAAPFLRESLKGISMISIFFLSPVNLVKSRAYNPNLHSRVKRGIPRGA